MVSYMELTWYKSYKEYRKEIVSIIIQRGKR